MKKTAGKISAFSHFIYSEKSQLFYLFSFLLIPSKSLEIIKTLFNQIKTEPILHNGDGDVILNQKCYGN
jgi:hypothetical protein